MYSLNPKETNMTPIRRLVLHSDSPQVISITEKDMDELLEGAELVKASARHGDSLEEAIQKVLENEEAFENAKKAILVIRTGPSCNLNLKELSDINKVAEKFPNSCEVKWGMSNSSRANYKVALICVTAH